MRIAVISDIHANPHALTKALASAKRGKCEHIICLGDIVGYGYDPNECIELCKRNNIECIKGNHEAGLLGEVDVDWFSPTAKRQILLHRDMVLEENKDWLRELPLTIEKELDGRKYAFAHGTYSIPRRFDYLDDMYSVNTELDVIRSKGIDALFVGHTHEAIGYYCPSEESKRFSALTIPQSSPSNGFLDGMNWVRGVFNVGSVGYPRRQKFCYYCILDTETKDVEWRHIQMSLTEYRNRLLAAGMQVPNWVEARIDMRQ